jgi:flagellin
VSQLQTQISETFENATFGGKPLFDGEQVSFQVGPDANTTQSVTPSDGSIASVIAGIDISTQAGAQAAIDISDQAAEEINTQRAELGAFQNTLTSTIKGLGNQRENIAASQSRIEDTDYAKAVSDQVANDILSQASVALRGQANRSAESILGLL